MKSGGAQRAPADFRFGLQDSCDDERTQARHQHHDGYRDDKPNNKSKVVILNILSLFLPRPELFHNSSLSGFPAVELRMCTKLTFIFAYTNNLSNRKRKGLLRRCSSRKQPLIDSPRPKVGLELAVYLPRLVLITTTLPIIGIGFRLCRLLWIFAGHFVTCRQVLTRVHTYLLVIEMKVDLHTTPRVTPAHDIRVQRSGRRLLER